MSIEETTPPALALAAVTPALETKLAALTALLATFDRVVVAFSGGVDSAFVLRVAHDVLGARVLALTARSASLPKLELDDAVALARELGVRHRVIDTRELDRPGYVENAPTRCYFCKTELFDVAALTAHGEGEAIVVDGFNADDGKDHQHGHRAANEHGVRHPLAEVGLGKAEVRALSKHLGLRTWNKPQLACLSSRVPHGMEVTPERLGRIEAVELVLRRLGFFDVRARLVRDNDDLVRLEIGEAELERVLARDVRAALVQAAHDVGFRFVTLDLEPFRSGRLNEAAEPLVRIGPRRRADS